MCHKHIVRHEWPYGLNKKIEKVLLLLGLNPEGCVTGIAVVSLSRGS